MRVLVTAASRNGSTAAIAQAIGEVLQSDGLEVTVIAPDEIGALREFDAVVLGSAVYTGHWLSPAIGLAERIGRELPGRPVWLFSSGPVGDPSRKLVQQMGADQVDLPLVLKATRAREHKMFAGKLDRRNLRGLQRAGLFVFRSIEGDFRDWQGIREWADSIAEQLLAATAA
jgi:menaquinone-dependent protoporphyrinogen oxidase